MKLRKCTIERPCKFLSPRLDGITRGRALFQLRTINLHTGKERSRGYAYRDAKGERGMMLNFCPFCGADFT